MLNRKIYVKNSTGLHVRPTGMLCKKAAEYESKIYFTVRNNTANAKSVLSVLGACVRCGDELDFTIEGEDEYDAMDEIVKLFDEGFGE